MSVLTSTEYKPLRKSYSLPHIASRHDSGVSGYTTTTTISGSGSCSLLDHIDYNSTMCNEHNLNNSNHNHYHYYHNHLHHNNNNSKIRSHHSHHPYDNVRKFFRFNCVFFRPLVTFCRSTFECCLSRKQIQSAIEKLLGFRLKILLFRLSCVLIL